MNISLTNAIEPLSEFRKKSADFKGVDKFDIDLATAKEFLQIIQELP